MVDLDVEEIRKLKESGDIMPLEGLIEKARHDYSGRVIEIELEEEDHQYIYEMEIVDGEGVVWEIKIDARTGELLEQERED